MTLQERFDANYSEDWSSGCWLWCASLNNGYGQIAVGSRTDGTKRPRRAHIVAYELHRGAAALGLEFDHLCRRRNCVNPWHLETVTHQENMQRVNWRFRSAKIRATVHHCKRGHEFTEENTRWCSDGSRACRICIRANKRARNALIGAAFAFVMFHRLDGHSVWVNTAQVNTIQSAGQLSFPSGTLANVGGQNVIVQENVNQVVEKLRSAK